MRKKQWLKSKGNESLHTGSFVITRNCATACDTSHLKCAACLCVKATIKSPQSKPHPSSKQGLLKTNHVMPGSCISGDHYFSPIQGHLLHTYGRERQGYTCGSHFMDHDSGKIFKFPLNRDIEKRCLPGIRCLHRGIPGGLPNSVCQGPTRR